MRVTGAPDGPARESAAFSPGRKWPITPLALAAVALAYAIVASVATPFTDRADLAVALPCVLLAVAVTLRISTRATALDRPGRDGSTSPAGPWLVAAGVVVAWELVTYAGAPRLAHPTLSSLLDGFDADRLRRIVTWCCWLALGRALVRR
jgi:hypothetical protein